MIHCCLCEYSHDTTIAAHVIEHHRMSLIAYCEMFPGMPIGSIAGIAETVPEPVVRRSKIVHNWWPAKTVLVIVNSGRVVRSISGKVVRGIAVATDKFRAGFGIQDADTRVVYSSPTGWVRDRAPWISNPNGWKIVKPQQEI
ncbi:MAG: hypothetical protein JNL74_04725 [Fibrobacteres bacterium]|nr:hypothetical protein [Fibrobacterota bacterium]